MLKIRLTRVGKKNSPHFRVVVAEHSKAVKRAFIEILGHYNPISQPKEIVIDKEKALAWISKGAQPTPTVNNLMVDLGILPKKSKANIVHGRPTKKKDAGKGEEAAKQSSGAAEEAKTEDAPADEVVEENVETVAEEAEKQSSGEAEEIPVEAPAEEKPTEEIAESPSTEAEATAEPVAEESK